MTAFVFTENPKFTAEVEVAWPNADGSFKTMSFTGHFIMDADVDLAERIEGPTAEDRRFQEVDRLKEVFVGWDGIKTPDGSDLEVSDDAMDLLLKQVPIRLALHKTYIAQVYGGGLRLGNSAPSPAPSGGNRKTRRAAKKRH